ncbi:MAG: hypothetical protein LBL06_01850 [Treponema sp.]|jgi:TolB-like protein|nr:hypothetical protein [Treponema sp.]
MKKMILTVLLSVSAIMGFGQDVLDNAIEKAGKNLSGKLKGGYVLLLDIFAPDAEDAGKYITYGLQTQLVNNKGLGLVDRSGVINGEIAYQLSGSVSDDTAQSIANQIGASAVIYGVFERLGSSYQLSLRIIGVGTTRVLYAEVFGIRKDKRLSDLLGEGMAVSQQIAERIRELEQVGEFGPNWVGDSKSYGMLKYENKQPHEATDWVYKVISASGTSESAAKGAVRRAIQQQLVEGISTVFQSIMDSTINAAQDIYGDYTEIADVMTQACSAARARVPNYSELQQYTATTQREDGRTRYTVYQLIRISESDMKAAVASVDVAQIFKILDAKVQELHNGDKMPQDITINITNNETYVTQINQTAMSYIEVNGF